jgi:dihydrofolate reductase
MIADQFVEYLLPLRQDAEVTPEVMKEHDLVILGGAADNALSDTLARVAGIVLGRNTFRWMGKTYAEPDDGLFMAMPNPFARGRMVYLFAANSALQLYQMTKRHQSLPTWAVFKGETAVLRGFLEPAGMAVKLP